MLADYYVDASRPDDSGDGSTPETAKRHIQAAVDICPSGGTVWVAEGLYNEGVNICGWDNARARVIITNKVHLVASGARERTVIEGAYDAGTGGPGPNAVRCVYVYYNTHSSDEKKSNGSIIEGFTLRRGASVSGGNGGGISMQNSYALNCAIEDCCAFRGGGLNAGSAIRCYVTGCWTTGNNAYGAVASTTAFLNSIIVRQTGSDRLFNYPSTMVNCTIVGNGGAGNFSYGTSKFKFYNTIYADNSSTAFNTGAYRPIASNCVVKAGVTGCSNPDCGNVRTNSSEYTFAGPALGDWRPTAAMEAEGAGDAELLKAFTLPAALESQRYLDFYGKPIPQTGAITCGAVQEVADVTGDLMKFDGGEGWEIEDRGAINGTKPEINYAWTDGRPGMIKIRKLGAALTNLVWYTLSTNGVKYTDLFPTTNDWAGVVPLPGVTNTIAAINPSKVLYVDAQNGDDAADGSAATPLATIQMAVTNAPNGSSKGYKSTVILVRRGVYDRGGGQSCRVNAMNKIGDSWQYRNLRIVAEAGPEETSIVGGSGCRCFSGNLPSLLQGFTLTGAQSSGDGAVADANSPNNACLADCIITGNTGAKSIVYNIKLFRCRISGNVITGSAASDVGDVVGKANTSRALMVDCEVVHSAESGNTYAVGQYADVMFSAVKGPVFNQRNLYYGSILSGGQVLGTLSRVRYSFASGAEITATGTGLVENSLHGGTKCVAFDDGDFRLKSNSPCLGMVTLEPTLFVAHASLDLDGRPLKLDTLTGNTAGPRQNWSVEYIPQGTVISFR